MPGDFFSLNFPFYGLVLFEEPKCQFLLAYYDQRIEGGQNDLKDVTALSCNLSQIQNNNDGSMDDRCWFTNFGPVYLQDIENLNGLSNADKLQAIYCETAPKMNKGLTLF